MRDQAGTLIDAVLAAAWASGGSGDEGEQIAIAGIAAAGLLRG